MRKLLSLLVIFCLAISTATAAEFNSANAYGWLASKAAGDGSVNDVTTTSWAVLAFDKAASSANAEKSLEWIFSQQSATNCFPSSPCKTKDTAMAMLAMNKLQRVDNMTEIQDALAKMLVPSSTPGQWLLEVSTDKTGTCKLEWEINGQKKDKTVAVDRGRFTECSNSYFLNLRDCVSTNLLNNPGISVKVDCTAVEGSKVITLVYRNANSFYVLSSATGDTADVVINNGCFSNGPGDSSCKKDPSMYAAWAAKETSMALDVKMYLMDTYSEENADDNALLYLSTKDARYLAALKLIQKTDGSFDRNVLKTALAVMALKEDSAYSEQATKAVDWLKTKQKADGSFGTELETAAVLTAITADAVEVPGGYVPPTAICNDDGECQMDAGEDSANCPLDCPAEEEEEEPADTFSDCIVDGNCEPDYGETSENCADDCSCGDGKCDDYEESEGTCEEDCAATDAEPSCGDGSCNGDEDEESCPDDCAEQPVTDNGGSTKWIIVALIVLIVIAGGIFGAKKLGLVKSKGAVGAKPGYAFPKPIGMPPMGPSKVPSMRQMASSSRPSGFARPASKSKDEELDKSLAEARKLLGK